MPLIKKQKILMLVSVAIFTAAFFGFSRVSSAQVQSINLSADPASGDARLDVIFTYELTNFPSCGNRFYWDFGDGKTIAYDEPCGAQASTIMVYRASSIVYSYINPGTYSVVFGNGLATSSPVTISVSTPPPGAPPPPPLPPPLSIDADLVIDGVTTTPAVIATGTPVKISFSVRNAGTVWSGPFRVAINQVSDKEQANCFWNINGLQPGQSFATDSGLQDVECPIGRFGILSAQSPGFSIIINVDDQMSVAESCGFQVKLRGPTGTP